MRVAATVSLLRVLAGLAVLGATLPFLGSTATAAEERRFAKDKLSCPYLTRPAVEKCGARLNYHSGGQVLCHDDRLMHCLGGRWSDRGACSAVGQGYPLAADVERSVFNTDIYESEGDDCEGQSSSTRSTGPGDVDSSGGATPAPGGGSAPASLLQGDSPVSQKIEEEQQRLRQVQKALDREEEEKRSRAAAAGASTVTGSGASRSNQSQCSEMRRGLAEMDDRIRSLDSASQALGTGGAEVNRLIEIRAMMRRQYANEGCQ
jgi:hypothetical protein